MIKGRKKFLCGFNISFLRNLGGGRNSFCFVSLKMALWKNVWKTLTRLQAKLKQTKQTSNPASFSSRWRERNDCTVSSALSWPFPPSPQNKSCIFQSMVLQQNTSQRKLRALHQKYLSQWKALLQHLVLQRKAALRCLTRMPCCICDWEGPVCFCKLKSWVLSWEFVCLWLCSERSIQALNK